MTPSICPWVASRADPHTSTLNQVACPCPNCSSRLLRRVLDTHVQVYLPPSTLHPPPWTLDPGPWTLDPGPWTLDPKPQTPYREP